TVVTMITVEHGADLSRQRSSRRRYESASGCIGKAFERDKRPHDSVLPFAAVRAASGPVSPIFLGVAQGVLGIDGALRILMRLIPGQDERHSFAFRDFEFRHRR